MKFVISELVKMIYEMAVHKKTYNLHTYFNPAHHLVYHTQLFSYTFTNLVYMLSSKVSIILYNKK